MQKILNGEGNHSRILRNSTWTLKKSDMFLKLSTENEKLLEKNGYKLQNRGKTKPWVNLVSNHHDISWKTGRVQNLMMQYRSGYE